MRDAAGRDAAGSDAALTAAWEAAWPAALGCWSPYTRLGAPHLLWTEAEEAQEQLTGSFAMIRLTDHAVVVSLRQVRDRGLGAFALPILAHEVGHHVLAPGDLADHARVLGRVRQGLGDRAAAAPMVANLYTDLLINDRLQREQGLDMAGVFRALGPPGSELFTLYLRIYEHLWELPRGDLAGPTTPALDLDAELGARVVRAWRRAWLRGAGRFALLLRPYLAAPVSGAWLDALAPGLGADAPDGLVDDDGLDDLVHPAEEGFTGRDPRPSVADPRLTDLAAARGSTSDERAARSPAEYLGLLGALGVAGTPEHHIARYYRERARPHLIPFPSRPLPRAADPIPEGLERWEPGDPLAELDWGASLAQNPRVIVGVTTARRVEGEAPGGAPAREVPDLYLGVDCSGSMPNPSQQLSYPVLAGAVLLGSALRAGAAAMVTLSGESPGRWTSTGGFVRRDLVALEVLTRYLGTGYSFGIERLRDTFVNGPPRKRPCAVIVVSDSDLFTMVARTSDGEALMAQVAATCGAGATAVLNLAGTTHPGVATLERLGWRVAPVAGLPALLAFARQFSRQTYGSRHA